MDGGLLRPFPSFPVQIYYRLHYLIQQNMRHRLMVTKLCVIEKELTLPRHDASTLTAETSVDFAKLLLS